MTEKLTRATPTDLEVRSDARTIVGIAVPFDAPTQIANSYTEVFRLGSFKRTIAERGASKVKLLAAHSDRELPIGRAISLKEDRAGLLGEFTVSKTDLGDQVLELVRDGALDALSIGFTPINNHWEGRTVERLEVRLHEVSVVAFPAYEQATITAVRNDNPFIPSTELARRRFHLASQRR